MASAGGVAPGARATTPHLSYGYMKRSRPEPSAEEGELIQCMTERLKKRVEEGHEEKDQVAYTMCGGMGLWNAPTTLGDNGSPPCQVRHDSGTQDFGTVKSDEYIDVHQDAEEAEPPTVRTAWLSAAMAWRQKNMPSPSELKKRREEVSRRISEAARRRNCARDDRRNSRRMDVQKNVEQQKLPEMPEDCASESEWKAYFRMYHTLRIADATSFVQVLRAFNIPCSDPKKIKTAYMQAVRMYHPDSNSKSRKWSSARGKAEAEEIMKLINSRKPDDFQSL